MRIMSKQSAQVAAPVCIDPGDEKEFQALVGQWRQATAHLSNTRLIRTHPAFLKIIGMGQRAIPLILRELTGEGNWAFSYALQIITGETPNENEPEALRKAWLAWAEEKGFLKHNGSA
jgi:hypothetical protein